MKRNHYKSPIARKNAPAHLHKVFGQRKALRFFCRLLFLLRRNSRRFAKPSETESKKPQICQGYDPELLFVECGRCGAPIIWEPGRATALLESAGIDPLELDPYCMLMTDGCPACKPGREYHVRIFRLGDDFARRPPTCGHA